MPPVILIIGPSGVGKSYVSGLLEREWSFHYWRIYSFESNGLPSSWDGRGELVDMPRLITAAYTRRAIATGYVVSIAPEDVFGSSAAFRGPYSRCYPRGALGYT
jgi:hypothetical protein